MDRKIRIHLADDHQVLIDGMQTLLKTHPQFEVIGFSLNGENLIQDALENNCDILVMDINMPIKDGIGVMKEYQPQSHPFKIIILSSYDDFKIIKEVLRYGAQGYLSKECAGENIIEAIETVMSGKEYFSSNIQEKILNFFTNQPLTSSRQNSRGILNGNLTEREIEIIRLIAMEYSNKEISEELNISISTVETHRKNLGKKLNLKSTVGLVKYAIKNNLINT